MQNPEPDAAAKTQWLKRMLQATGVVLFLSLVYLLSLGPVLRYSCTTTMIVMPPTTGPGGVTHVTKTTITIPAWVQTAYYPVFEMAWKNPRGSALVDSYRSYLEWWQKK